MSDIKISDDQNVIWEGGVRLEAVPSLTADNCGRCFFRRRPVCDQIRCVPALRFDRRFVYFAERGPAPRRVSECLYEHAFASAAEEKGEHHG